MKKSNVWKDPKAKLSATEINCILSCKRTAHFRLVRVSAKFFQLFSRLCFQLSIKKKSMIKSNVPIRCSALLRVYYYYYYIVSKYN